MVRQPNTIDKLISYNLKTVRLNSGLSLQKISERLGVSYQQIQKYENGKNRISAGRLWHLSQIYGVPIEIFFKR